MKYYEVPACSGVFTKHCNFYTEIDFPPSGNDETPQKLLLWLAVALSLKVWEQIFENDYYGLKKRN